MIKKIIRYLRKRKDMKLRKWCITLAANELSFFFNDTATTEIYTWVKEQP